MAIEKPARRIFRLAMFGAACACLALLGRGQVPITQAVNGVWEQYLQSDLTAAAAGSLATSMYLDARASYNIPYFDCSFQIYDWMGVREGYYNHFGQIGFEQYNTNPNCPAAGTPVGWNPYGFSVRAEVGVDYYDTGYLTCNYGAVPTYTGYENGVGYHFACFVPFSDLAMAADHTYNWSAFLVYNGAPICFPYGCSGDYLELAVVDPSTGIVFPVMYYDDTGATQINNFFKDGNEFWSLWSDLTNTNSYNDLTAMYESYAYFSGSGWIGFYSSQYLLTDSEFLQPNGFGYSLCYATPPVGMDRITGGFEIYGGSYYTCT